jgi:hypothetical protein
MSFIHSPGNVVVDETSLFGQHAHLPSGEAADWPDNALWLDRMRHWLTALTATQVGRTVLTALQTRPASAGIVVRIVRLPRRVPEAMTDGPIGAGDAGNPSASPTVFITFTPADARGGPINLAPMRHPGSVLCHELAHAVMNVHRLNAIIESDGSRRAIAGWTSGPYPNHNEFCATTVQNMLLSEMGARLSDGYQDDGDSAHDDPWIESTLESPARSTVFGMSATTRTDVAGFVRSYRPPLDFLAARLPAFTSALAGLSAVAFNPFAHMRATAAAGAPSGSGGCGAARSPGPTDSSRR